MEIVAALSFETLVILHKSTLNHKSEAFLPIQFFEYHYEISVSL